MDQERLDHRQYQYTWPNPVMGAVGQKHPAMQDMPEPYPYDAAFHSISYPPRHYQLDVQLSPTVHPLSPPQQHSPTSPWNNVSPLPYGFGPSCVYYAQPQHPISPPTLHQYIDPCHPLRQHPPSHSIESHTQSPNRQRDATDASPRATSSAPNRTPDALRGPPRKPRQSGHALWVGNLPFSTDIVKLKEHFSEAATTTIQSVFWISKSKSAFVNYSTSEALSNAMNRFHNSRFQGVRLVCRIRRADMPVPIPTPTITTIQPEDDNKRGPPSAFEDPLRDHSKGNLSESPSPGALSSKAPLENDAKKRFFVMKSLAQEDVESSVRTGHWVTQEHNESALNKAFASADDVFLIFSINKSGEYFGYARMQGLIADPSPEPRSTRPAEDGLEPADAGTPEIISTPSTVHAPNGAIYIDAYRGIIFWEADIAKNDDPGPQPSSDMPLTIKSSEEAPTKVKSKVRNLSSPFEIKWLSTARLPFYRTRGLRNPWNANRDVKIARDGTELETNVGIRILELFHQTRQPVFWDANGCSIAGSPTHSPGA